MAHRKKSTFIETKDYRHTGEKRKNVPLAKIAAEGEVPKIKKAKYYFSPHLSPELRFDPEVNADQVLAVKEKISLYLTKNEEDLLDKALSNQQPWLEWAGKREEYDRGWFEVDPVVLHIHERVSSQAIIRAAMREDVQRDLFADPQLPYQEEIRFYKHDVDWANRLILGDSLHVMSSLSRRENLVSKMQMIYVDPPYGIKFASNFQPLVRQRNVRERAEDLSREAESVKAYRDAWFLGVHSYLEYLMQRLVLSRELLATSGSLFVQIGDENLHRVRALCDEVFGSRNFVSNIVLKKGGTSSSSLLSNIADYILWYAKDISELKYRQLYSQKELGIGESTGARYDQGEDVETGEHRPLAREERDNPSIIPNNIRAFKQSNPCSMHDNPRHREKPLVVHGKEFFPPSDRQWSSNPESMYRVIESNRIIPTGKNLAYIMYIDDYPAVPINNIWTEALMRVEKQYVVQTATSVVERCILMSTDPGDIVLDPTCGSGTTAFCAEKWGRRWITIDTSRVSIAIARQRLLTSKYEYYKLLDGQTVDMNYVYKTIPHITLKSIAQNQNLDPIFKKHRAVLSLALEKCNRALEDVSDDLRARLKLKLMEKQKAEGKRTITDSDQRRWELPREGEHWEEWEVPFDTDPDWPIQLKDAVTAYRKAWRAKMDQVNACISDNADQEELVDQPEVVKGIVRVSGPFTVEGVRPEELSIGEKSLFDGTAFEWADNEYGQDVANEDQNLRAYLSRMLELIREDGITFPNNKHQDFGRVEPLYEESTGTLIHAEAIWTDIEESEPNNIGITFGPQYGPVTAEQVGDIIRAGRRYDELVIAGFSFDAAALDAIQENQHPKKKIHIAHIRPDVSPGMDGLLKDTPDSQLFTVFGQPEIEVKQNKDGDYMVELLGVDIYDPLKGEVRSSKADKVAAWFLDSDYDGRCFCITQAFFPEQNAWDKIAKSLGSQADPEAFEAYKGTVSIPFKAGKHKRIAVKVIDPRGNEVMAVARLNKKEI